MITYINPSMNRRKAIWKEILINILIIIGFLLFAGWTGGTYPY